MMIMMKEKIPIVNDKDEVVDIKSISEVHKKGLIHREAYVYLINSLGKVLLQKRKDNGLWDHSAAGHFSEHESYIEGAKRELEEELGVRINLGDLKEITYKRIDSIKPNKKNLRFVKVYLVKKKIDLNDFKIDYNELTEIKFFDKKELQNLLNQPHLLTRSAKVLIEEYIMNLI